MLLLVAYDVSTSTPEGRKRLRAVSKLCETRGKRVQKSLFECSINAAQERDFTKALHALIDDQEDNLRIYYLGNRGFDKVTCLGNSDESYPEVLIY